VFKIQVAPFFLHVLWLAELLRVTDPRSDRNLKTRHNQWQQVFDFSASG
jgi:hypothetical protein